MKTNAWKLFWVQERSEVYAARSADEARAFVASLTRESVPTDEVGELIPTPEMTGRNDETGEAVNMHAEWERAKAEGITGPYQFWTGYL